MTRFSQTHAFAIDLDENGTSPISSLFRWRCPPTIITRIPLLIINAFNRVTTGWFLSHVVKKYTKVAPFSTHCDPSSTIQMEMLPMSIVTSGHHAHPCSIFRRVCIACCMPVYRHSNANCISYKTATTLRIATRQIDSYNNFLRTAIAQTYPFAMSISSLFGTVENHQSSKAFSC